MAFRGIAFVLGTPYIISILRIIRDGYYYQYYYYFTGLKSGGMAWI